MSESKKKVIVLVVDTDLTNKKLRERGKVCLIHFGEGASGNLLEARRVIVMDTDVAEGEED